MGDEPEYAVGFRAGVVVLYVAQLALTLEIRRTAPPAKSFRKLLRWCVWDSHSARSFRTYLVVFPIRRHIYLLLSTTKLKSPTTQYLQKKSSACSDRYLSATWRWCTFPSAFGCTSPAQQEIF